MKTRVFFVEDYGIMKEAIAFLEMLKAKRVKRTLILDTDVRMFTFALPDDYYNTMQRVFTEKYRDKIAFATIGR